MKRTSLPAFFFALTLAAACGPQPRTIPADDKGPTGLLALPEHGVQIASERVELRAGGEDVRCWYANLRNEQAFDVSRFQTARLPGLHHFNIFASDLQREDGWHRCPNGMELFGDARPIVDGSGSEVDYPFPEGLAVRLEPHTLIIAELHFINAQPAPAMQQFVLNLHSPAEPAHTLVDIYGLVSFDITLPPHQVTSVVKDCPIYDNIRVLTMSSHFHARGIRATAEIIRKDAAPELWYETTSWNEPKVERFEEPRYLGDGDVVRITCTYDNQDDFTVRYGPDAADEMCFVFGYYYPKVGLIPCF